MTDSRPARGRPSAFDRDAVSATAIALFAERGYDAVSMSDIADAAGVSRRGLFRHFASKAELIWDGLTPVEEARAQALAAAASATPFEALRLATLAGAAALPDPEATRTRLRIMGTHPELIAFGSGRMFASSQLLVAHLGERGLDPLAARTFSSAVTAAVFDAYLFWAIETADATPQATLEAAFERLARLGS
ncbi:MAG: TetR/AcrR family transcriptional regulator [Microbacteriaceae bacterium]|nr:TetR/AcrR family transcriptional regulator [Microbacteriaceae bacterium]MCL2793987.1 TetR/AcrR family transcriptional regulator [Microbacteriaceae bacterium]